MYRNVMENIGCCVYRYTDIKDGIIKYVGIVTKGNLLNRHKQHCREDWYKSSTFLCEYFEVNNKSEAEAIESHLISLYCTNKYFNKAKADWGINSYLPRTFEWIPIIQTYENIVDEMRFCASFRSDKKYKIYPEDLMGFADELEKTTKLKAFLKMNDGIMIKD